MGEGLALPECDVLKRQLKFWMLPVFAVSTDLVHPMKHMDIRSIKEYLQVLRVAWSHHDIVQTGQSGIIIDAAFVSCHLQSQHELTGLQRCS